ncbi:MAG: SH3-like domain-containing protein [Saprospiraceae bacterium]|nr:SH3-like domain-containing protein [Saprospiraceae bacterium]
MKNTTYFVRIGIAYILLSFLIFIGCNNGPKVIKSSASSGEKDKQSLPGIFASETNMTAASQSPVEEEVHTVVINEVLPTERYVYLNVTEGTEKFWIATSKQEVKVGATYFYKGGLLKTDFESKEYNRVFDKIYLVPSIVDANHAQAVDMANATAAPNATGPETKIAKLVPGASVKIADLVSNKKKYANQTIQVTGECTKLNPNIMGRNWIHLKDGSKDQYDFVITSAIPVPVGQMVTMVGTVILDKDFGAGYRYDLILENATIAQ